MPAAGVVLFIPLSQLSRVQVAVDRLNATGRVSDEVMQIYLVHPTRAHVSELVNQLIHDPTLATVRRIHALKPNSVLRDFTAHWRIPPSFAASHYILVCLETVNDAFKIKYPSPNLTLSAGTLEIGETRVQAAHRELMEEMRVDIDIDCLYRRKPVVLMSGGLSVFTYIVTPQTHLLYSSNVLHIFEGTIKR